MWSSNHQIGLRTPADLIGPARTVVAGPVPRLPRRQEVAVLLDRAVEHLQGDASLDVDRHDLSQGWLSVLVPDDREATSDQDEAAANIAESRPQPTVVGHVHEVHADVDGTRHERRGYPDPSM